MITFLLFFFACCWWLLLSLVLNIGYRIIQRWKRWMISNALIKVGKE